MRSPIKTRYRTDLGFVKRQMVVERAVNVTTEVMDVETLRCSLHFFHFFHFCLIRCAVCYKTPIRGERVGNDAYRCSSVWRVVLYCWLMYVCPLNFLAVFFLKTFICLLIKVLRLTLRDLSKCFKRVRLHN